jgi:hypothetical protein
MTSLDKDKAYLQAGVSELKDYLLSEELYWPVTARGYDLPRLTIGGLLIARARCLATGQEIDAFDMQLEAIRSSWRVAWEKKAAREYKARFRLWKNYLMDTMQSPEKHEDAYPYEVRYRVMVDLLGGELQELPVEKEALDKLDAQLRAVLVPSEFLWESELKPAFPPEVYWYLYGKLKI